MKQVTPDTYVERHNISIVSIELEDILFHAARYKNKVNYIIRNQYYFKRIKFPKNFRTILFNQLKSTNEYKNLGNNHIAKQIIRLILKDWSTYYKSLKEYKKDPSKFIAEDQNHLATAEP